MPMILHYQDHLAYDIAMKFSYDTIATEEVNRNLYLHTCSSILWAKYFVPSANHIKAL